MKNHYDVIVVGQGQTGLEVALDYCDDGYKTAMFLSDLPVVNKQYTAFGKQTIQYSQITCGNRSLDIFNESIIGVDSNANLDKIVTEKAIFTTKTIVLTSHL